METVRETGEFLRVVLQEFVRYVRDVTKLTEPGIARRAMVSQALINKITKGTQRREHTRDTYEKLTTAFAAEWENFLALRPEDRGRLRATFAWALGPAEEAPTTSEKADPLLAEAVRALHQLFRRATRAEKELIVRQLQLQAEDLRETRPAPGSRRRYA